LDLFLFGLLIVFGVFWSRYGQD